MRIVVILACLVALPPGGAHAATDTEKRAVLRTYADIALATYEDSLVTGQRLQRAVAALLAKPGPATLAAARRAWIAARVPYQQTETFRFGNKIVDDWEGKVNAWPLDEGLIDYVDPSYGRSSKANPLYAANVIAVKRLAIAGKPVDASTITKALLAKVLHEAGGVEANVATGYHAIEFLLWGQDLNGTGPGKGRAAVDGLQHGRLQQRQLRPASGLSPRRHRPADRRPCLDGPPVGREGRRAHRADERQCRQGYRDDPDRHRQPGLRRTGRRAHEARPAAPRPRKRSMTASRTTRTTRTITT